jgi:hypothetical protein
MDKKTKDTYTKLTQCLWTTILHVEVSHREEDNPKSQNHGTTL